LEKKNRFTFAIILKDTREVIGEITLHLIDPAKKYAQLAYWIGEPFWNQGLMTEAASAVLKYGFETLGFNLIYADCYADHIASQRVMIKNHMQKHRQQGTMIVYRMTKEEYLEKT
jgi:ribosomal-protein-alanine N-acetyltransferase